MNARGLMDRFWLWVASIFWGRGEKSIARDQRAARFRIWSWLVGKITSNRVMFIDAIWDYKNPRESLTGPKNDLQILSDLAKSYGYAVRKLVGSYSVRERWLAAYAQAIELANSGKRVRWFSTHHGSYTRGPEADGRIGLLYLYDGSVVSEIDVAALNARLKPGADFGLGLDICYSGEFERGIARGEWTWLELALSRLGAVGRWLLARRYKSTADTRRVRAVYPDACRLPEHFLAGRGDDTRASILTACGEHQTSAESRQANGLVYGELIYAFCQVVKAKGSLPFERMCNETTAIIERKGRAQRPQFRGVKGRLSL